MNRLEWNLDGWRCSQCKREFVPFNLETASGTVGEVSVTCEHLPCLSCPENHERVATSPDFGENLLDTMFGPGGIPKVRHKGLLRKIVLCPLCEHELPTATERSLFRIALVLRQPGVKHEVEFELTDIQHSSDDDPRVFSVELLCPAYTCTLCRAAIAVRGAELTSPIRQALALALDSQLKGGDK
jgi:hypothetical protein